MRRESLPRAGAFLFYRFFAILPRDAYARNIETFNLLIYQSHRNCDKFGKKTFRHSPSFAKASEGRAECWSVVRGFTLVDNVEFSIYNVIMLDIELPEPIIFEWDSGNQTKSLEKHGISVQEAEEAFYHYKLVIPDQRHSRIKVRLGMYGQTNAGKKLFIAFTIRNRRVRVVSARLADRKERKIYEEEIKKAT